MMRLRLGISPHSYHLWRCDRARSVWKERYRAWRVLGKPDLELYQIAGVNEPDVSNARIFFGVSIIDRTGLLLVRMRYEQKRLASRAFGPLWNARDIDPTAI